MRNHLTLLAALALTILPLAWAGTLLFRRAYGAAQQKPQLTRSAETGVNVLFQIRRWHSRNEARLERAISATGPDRRRRSD
jgi:hypothetical protein